MDWAATRRPGMQVALRGGGVATVAQEVMRMAGACSVVVFREGMAPRRATALSTRQMRAGRITPMAVA